MRDSKAKIPAAANIFHIYFGMNDRKCTLRTALVLYLLPAHTRAIVAARPQHDTTSTTMPTSCSQAQLKTNYMTPLQTLQSVKHGHARF
jgi:uncharacterized membrane protein